MFPQTTSYNAAYVGAFPANNDTHLVEAFRWAAEQAKGFGKTTLTVVAPTRERFEHHSKLAELSRGFEQHTFRTLSYNRAPIVVACWPDEKTLLHLDAHQNIEAMSVVPWLETDIAAWRIARQAIDLLGAAPTAQPPTIGDPAVLGALKSLTMSVNLSSGITHPSDHDHAIVTFRTLRDTRHRYDPDEIKVWALANGWRGEDAVKLAAIAGGIQQGKAYRLNSKMQHWRSDLNIIDWLRPRSGERPTGAGSC